MKKVTVVASALAVLTGGFVLSVSSPAAAAPGGNCVAKAEKKALDWQPDDWRVGAYCDSLNWDSRARGVGVVSAAPDHYTSYFTATNVWRWSGWRAGAIDSVRVEITGV